MKREIERKFLVKNTEFLKESSSRIIISQGYLSKEKGRIVRVRSTSKYHSIFDFTLPPLEVGVITIKTNTDGLVGVDEFEYYISCSDANKMLESCIQPLITKTRHIVKYKNTTWEVDVFHGHKEGLIMAEVELDDADDSIDIPSWIGEEVTDKPEYSNSNM